MSHYVMRKLLTISFPCGRQSKAKSFHKTPLLVEIIEVIFALLLEPDQICFSLSCRYNHMSGDMERRLLISYHHHKCHWFATVIQNGLGHSYFSDFRTIAGNTALSAGTSTGDLVGDDTRLPANLAVNSRGSEVLSVIFHTLVKSISVPVILSHSIKNNMASNRVDSQILL